ncbi:MAG TPA: hypothetical protein VLD37_04270 [Candidatus Bilamarchaeum sp.]|nr:hypothetical protein [Candidatus Bilamarchaeum sp.]
MPDLICSAAFGTFMTTSLLPLVAQAAIGTMGLVAISFMFGRALNNPKLTLWSKTEVVQLGVSLATIFIIMFTVNAFCAINLSEIAAIFDIPSVGSVNIYQGALTYLQEALQYSHNAMRVVRYHLQAYTVMSFLNAFICDFSTGNIGWGCFFGYGGDNQQPLGGFGAETAALNVAFNGTIMSYFSALNSLFILLFVYRGFVFLFLPIGIFLRAMPYLRGMGSLFIALALSFLLVFPFMLSVFYLMGAVLVDRGNNYNAMPLPIEDGHDSATGPYYDEKVFPDKASGSDQFFAVSTCGEGYVRSCYLSADGCQCNPITAGGDTDIKDNTPGALAFAGYAFIAAVFFPTVALLATIASVAYVARLFGEEIDLSRITQLV